ncbi:MAG: hypothetical protein JWN48_1412 [Myxococcaceae bacterium]|nr:hypothetical protein [Myxococcaceae bacterium]
MLLTCLVDVGVQQGADHATLTAVFKALRGRRTMIPAGVEVFVALTTSVVDQILAQTIDGLAAAQAEHS